MNAGSGELSALTACPAPSPPSLLASPADAAEALRSVWPVLQSDDLLQGEPCVHIAHGGALYVLRATRSGKLILTK